MYARFLTDLNYNDDPFIPPRGRKHNQPDLNALLHRNEQFVPHRGRRDKIKDIFKYDDLFFPNRGKRQKSPIATTMDKVKSYNYARQQQQQQLAPTTNAPMFYEDNLIEAPAVMGMRRLLAKLKRKLQLPHICRQHIANMKNQRQQQQSFGRNSKKNNGGAYKIYGCDQSDRAEISDDTVPQLAQQMPQSQQLQQRQQEKQHQQRRQRETELQQQWRLRRVADSWQAVGDARSEANRLHSAKSMQQQQQRHEQFEELNKVMDSAAWRRQLLQLQLPREALTLRRSQLSLWQHYSTLEPRETQLAVIDDVDVNDNDADEDDEDYNNNKTKSNSGDIDEEYIYLGI